MNMESGTKIKDGPSRILIATDGSKTAENAATLGIKFAQQYGAKVYAVYVINITAYETVYRDESWSIATFQAFDKWAHRTTSSVVEKAKFAGLHAEPIILKGNPAEKILDFADKHDIDMIVVGSLGKSEIERFVLGSVSEKVVRHAKVPVLVVR
jgi:nucleotide-binding universal stress UspA family protein